jgi:hypothetical protein
VNVFRHDHIADHHELVFAPGFLQNSYEEIASAGAAQYGSTMIATAGDEVEVPGTVIAVEVGGHRCSVKISRMVCL